MDLMVTNQGGGSSSPLLRDYRKGNWTVQETMVLIEAKKMDEERRMKRQVGESSEGGTKPAELRWKWVEDYCWRNGCLRSQNQCNDKWDNLMRDFKKIRDFERRKFDELQQQVEQCCSYWKMEKSDRKDKHLPSNMLPQIYEALVDVVDRKGQRFFCSSGGGGGGSSPNIMSSMLGQVACNVVPVSFSPALQRQVSFAAPLPPISPQQQPPQQQPPHQQPPPPLLSLPFSQPFGISDSDTSEYSDSPAKRRRREKEIGDDQRRSTTPIAVGPGGGTATDSQQLDDSAITKSASLIVGAIQASEEKEERRHKELLNMQERRLQIEESNAEINRQVVSGLVDAINNLVHSLLAMASNKNLPTPPK